MSVKSHTLQLNDLEKQSKATLSFLATPISFLSIQLPPLTDCSFFHSLIKGDAILAGCHSCSVCAQGACWEGAETGVTCDCPVGRSGSLCDLTTAPNPCQNNRLVQNSSDWQRNSVKAAIHLVLFHVIFAPNTAAALLPLAVTKSFMVKKYVLVCIIIIIIFIIIGFSFVSLKPFIIISRNKVP